MDRSADAAATTYDPMNRWLTATIAFCLFASITQVAAQEVADRVTRLAQISPRLVNPNLGNYVDSTRATHPVQLWALTNSHSGGTEYFLLALPLPSVGHQQPFPLVVFINSYTVLPGPPSANPEDVLWTSLIQKPGPYYDLSFPKIRALNCSSPSGDCEITTAGLAVLKDLASLSDFEGKSKHNADWVLSNGCALVMAFARHYAGRDTISVIYGIENTLEALMSLPTTDPGRIAIIGRSQGAELAIHSLAIPGRPLSINSVVAEAPWIDAPGIVGYYLQELPTRQAAALFKASFDFAVPFLNRLARASAWPQINTASVADRFNTPVLLIHGTDDMMVPVEQSTTFALALRDRGKGALVTLQIYQNGPPLFGSKTAVQAGHGVMDANSSLKVGSLASAWLREKLSKK